jgi:hypothetical protein
MAYDPKYSKRLEEIQKLGYEKDKLPYRQNRTFGHEEVAGQLQGSNVLSRKR